MSGDDEKWMVYIDSEVRDVCEVKSWGHQIRRKWSVRGKPVSESPIDDYEWKLIPGVQGKLPDDPHGFIDGTYYVLCFDKPNGRFVFQHDTFHAGRSTREVETYSVISLIPQEMQHLMQGEHKGLIDDPPKGWLRNHLLSLSNQFKPNVFSAT